MKVLVIVAHPSMEMSRVNKAWMNAFRNRHNVTVRDLTAEYPDMAIDILAEQALLLEHDRIILQFPLYWYSSPPILKQWMDLVFQPGFAYAVGGDKLHGKEFVVATSVGSQKELYRAGSYNNFSVDELLRPFQQTVDYVGGKYLSPYCFYRSIIANDADIQRSADELMEYVLDSDINPVRDHDDLINDSIAAMFSRYELAVAE